MTVLVVGASGATGRLLLEQLLQRGQNVRAIVRSPDKLPDSVRSNPALSIIQGSLLDLTDDDLIRHVSGCSAIASCLGHNLSVRGIFGPPHRLVTRAAIRLCKAVRATKPEHSVRYVLMNTAGNSNRDLQEPASFARRFALAIIRRVLPPQADNEQAADFLRTRIGRDNPIIEWAAVRPDTLINADQVSEYEVYPSPTRSSLFNAGKTSRINVAHFMAELITNDTTWNTWKGQMPVIYNKSAA